MAVKFMVRDFNGRVDMGVTDNIVVTFNGYDNEDRNQIHIETAYTKHYFYVQDQYVRATVNGKKCSAEEALEAVFDNTNKVSSIGILGRNDGYLDIQILMSK